MKGESLHFGDFVVIVVVFFFLAVVGSCCYCLLK